MVPQLLELQAGDCGVLTLNYLFYFYNLKVGLNLSLKFSHSLM